MYCPHQTRLAVLIVRKYADELGLRAYGFLVWTCVVMLCRLGWERVPGL